MDALTAVLFAVGLVLLVVGAEALVRGASSLAVSIGISPLVVGLTVVAYGTSSPEMAVSVSSSLAGEADLAIGNVVGSNIFNVLVILGLSALVGTLVVAQQLVRREVPLMIGLSVLTLVLVLDGGIGRLDGALLAAGAAGYTAWAIVSSRRESAAVAAEYEAEFGEGAGGAACPWFVNVGLIVVGLGALVLGSRWLVDGAVELAEALGLSELVIGLTIVAAGTSLPEVATSVIATIRGERDIAVGNVIGSNIFNILAVLGLGGLVAPDGLPAADATRWIDLPVMIAVALACLPVFFTGYAIRRWEGVLFLAAYATYTTWLVLDASGHDATDEVGTLALVVGAPLVAATLATVAVRELRANRRAPGATPQPVPPGGAP